MRDVANILLGAGLACICIGLALGSKEPVKPFSLIVTLQSGDEYVINDFRTLKDCNKQAIDLFGGDVKGVECVSEQ